MDLKKSKHLIVKITENALEQRIGGPSNDFAAELKELGDLLASYEQVRNMMDYGLLMLCLYYGF